MLQRFTIFLCICFLIHPALLLAKNAEAQRFQVESFSLSPALISPNGDGLLDGAVAQVVFLCRSTGLSAPGQQEDKKGVSRQWKVAWTLQVSHEGTETPIHSFSGSHLLVPTTNTPWQNGLRSTATIPWNGLDETGQSLPSGRYTLSLQASFIRETTVRLRANRPETKVQTLTIGTVQLSLGTLEIDLTAPTLTIIFPSENLYVQESAAAVTGTCFDDNLDTVTVNGIEVTLLDGNFTTTVLLVEGNNVFRVEAKDKARNITIVERTIIRDTIAPVVSFTEPATQNSFSGTVNTLAAGIVQELNLAEFRLQGEVLALTNGSFSKSLQLPEGPNTLVAETIDLAGNIGRAELQITIDCTSPMIAISEPADDTWYPENAEVVVIGSLAESNLSFFKINNQTVTVENGSFSHIISLPQEGPNTITCIAEDLAGNTAQVDLVINRDSIAPSLAIVPAEGTALTTNLPTLTATFSDLGAGIALPSFSALLDAVNVTAKFPQSATGASWQLAPTDTLAEGEHVLTIQIADNAGNTASETVTFTAPASTHDPGWDDSSPPLVLNMSLSQRFFCPAENPYAPPDKRKVVATFNLSEPSLVSLNIYKPNGDVLKSVNLGRLDIGEHTTEWNGCAPDGRYMVDGVYELGLSLQDLHGNPGTETRATVVLYY